MNGIIKANQSGIPLVQDAEHLSLLENKKGIMKKSCDKMTDPIIKKGVRILRPNEFNQLLDSIPKYKHQLIIKTLLFTGMRFKELERLKKHPDWLFRDSKHIHLPETAIRKSKRKQKDRWISLNSWGYDIVRQFLNNSDHLPTRQTIDENLKKWAENAGIESKGICLKSFRKTIEGWLVSTYPEKTPFIYLRQRAY